MINDEDITTVPIFLQNTIAIIWDFDNTLTAGSMQSPIVDAYNIDEREFWQEVNNLGTYYQGRHTRVNQSTAYLNHILSYVRRGIFPDLSNSKLGELGKEITFYDGLPQFFQTLKELILNNVEFQRYSINLEHYIVSTGLARMIRGSDINPYVDGIWGCEFIEDVAEPRYLSGEQKSLLPEPGVIQQVGYWLDDTTKTRALFEINKGANKYPVDVNDTIPKDQRRVPFKNMVYIADGPSDIPVFSILKEFQGRTFAVFKPHSEKEFQQVYYLQRQGRVEAYGPADYRDGSQTSLWVIQTVRDIATRIVGEKDSALRATVKPAPHHIDDTSEPLSPDVSPQQSMPGFEVE